MVIANKYITKMSNKLQEIHDNVVRFAHTYAIELWGSVTGSSAGMITWNLWFDSIYAIIMAFVTGACGALGAYMIKKLFEKKTKSNKNG